MIPESDRGGQGRDRLFAGLLFLVGSLLASILRIVYLLPLRGHPLFDEAHRDSIAYVERAREILNGDFWGSGVYFHSAPLYPYFLALIMGPAGATGLWWVRVVQALLSGVTAGLLSLTALRLFGRAAAVATAVMAILYAPFLFYAGELLEITLTMFFLALAAWVMAREKLSDPGLIGVGALLGAAALGKPNLLLLAPLLLLHLGFLRPLRKPLAWPWRRGLLLTLGVLLLVMPFTLRNRLVGDDWVLISSNGGINLFIGNNPQASGGFQVPTAMQADLENSSRSVASRALGKELSPSETSRFWGGRAWHFMKSRPADAAALLWRKTGLLIGAYEIPNHFNFYFFREYLAPVLRWPLAGYTLVLPLGVLGLIFGLRRNRAARLAAASLLLIAASVVLFFVTSRYRLPVLIWLLPFAGHGLVMLLRMLRERRWRLLPLALALLVGVGLLMQLPLVGVKDFHDDFVVLAHYWSGKGGWEKAAHYNREALRQNDRSAMAWQNLGYALTQLGVEEEDTDRAEECYYKALELDPTNAYAYGNLAHVYFMWNRPELFSICLERALLLDPSLESTLSEMVHFRSAKLVGWRDVAEKQLAAIEEKIAADPGNWRLFSERGRIIGLRLERHAEGIAIFDEIPAEMLAEDAALAKRLAMLRRRIIRSQRYGHLLRRPLPSAPGPSALPFR
jgi:4-amino-4-deoxy-L-arabinose transferase-like glycosyltransferase